MVEAPRARGLIVRYGAWPIALVALGVAGSVALSVHGATETQDARDGETAAQATAQKVAAPLARICDAQPATAAAAGADCPQVAVIAQAGAKGDTGAAGRGVAATAIVSGRLLVTYDDGTRTDVGQVVGADGRGIASTVLDGGRLVLVYSDGTRVDLGEVVGARGRGIISASTDGGRLTITYDDGTTQDAGPLPKGDNGANGTDGAAGAPGPTCPDGFQPVETGGTTGADGTRYSRSITCVDPASAQPDNGIGQR